MTYETQQDRAREKKVLEIFTRKLGGGRTFTLEEEGMPFDARIVRRGEEVAFVEVKSAFYSVDRYPHAIVDVAKVEFALGLAELADVPFVLVVRWNDAIGFRAGFKWDFPKAYKTRKDRNDPNDRDLCFEIPTSEFRLVVDKRNKKVAIGG